MQTNSSSRGMSELFIPKGMHNSKRLHWEQVFLSPGSVMGTVAFIYLRLIVFVTGVIDLHQPHNDNFLPSLEKIFK